MSVDISVVVCTHDEDRWSDVQAALRSVKEQSLPPHDVVVVVDHNDSLLRRASSALVDVKVVQNSGTRGLGGARNSGIEVSSGSVVAFLDDDAIASRGWLAHLAERYRDPAVAGVGGSIEPRWTSRRPAWFPEEFDWVVGCTYRGMPHAAQEVRNLIGCNMSYRRETLDALGRFRLGYGCDETEFCIRLRQRWPEKKLLYVPEAKVFHKVSHARTTFASFISRCYFEGGSKAVVSRLVGGEDALASERRYVSKVLPAAAARNVREFLRGGDSHALARTGAIALGLASTTSGFVAGRMFTTNAARRRGWSGTTFP